MSRGRSELLELFRKFLEVLDEDSVRRMRDALVEAIERRDPSLLYHRLGELSPGYYGGQLPFKEPSDYYKEYPASPKIKLPQPRLTSGVDVLQAIRSRRSRRSYSSPLTLEEVATVLYYAVGITGRAWWGGPKRVYPSAGALQPVEAYLCSKRVEGAERGLYHYNPGEHSLELLSRGDCSKRLYFASLEQEHVWEAPAVIILTAVYRRTGWKYGFRSYRYVHWDVGFAGENIYLAAEALNLATTAVGAFYDDIICDMLEIDCYNEIPMLLFPLGRRAEAGSE